MGSWIGFVFTEVYALALLGFVFRRTVLQNKDNLWLKVLLGMLALYLGHLFYVLLCPVYFYRRFSFSIERLNLVPFRAAQEWLANPVNLFGNVLLFMPVGFFEVLLHPGRSRKWQTLFSAATACMLSLFIELSQCFNYRVPDVDDIILNTLGSVVGALLCIGLQKIGFDQTRIGRVLLPRIPRFWRRHMLLNRFCVLLVVSLEAGLFAVNYFVTIPKPEIRQNMAAQTAAALSAAQGSQTAQAAAAHTEAPEPTKAPTATPAPKVYHTESLALEARNVLLVKLADQTEGEQVIYAVNSASPIYPASTLKMLTALTVLDFAAPDETVQIGTEVYLPPLDAARAGLEYGMKLSVYDLLEGLLLPSGADAAYALGVYCGRIAAQDEQLSQHKAVQRFVAEMNRKAEAIGAKHTKAVNVVGLDDKNQMTTAEDIYLIARHFLQQPVLAQICSLPAARIHSENGRTVSLKNTNKMLQLDSVYYNGDVAGVKTGTTSRAGNCLVSLFTIADKQYLSIVMNSSYDGKFTDTQRLYDLCAEALAAP